MFDIFVNIGLVLQSLGSFFKDILIMRTFLVFGIAFEMVYLFRVTKDPLWSELVWSILFILINSYQIIVLLNERTKTKLNDKETRLMEIVFPMMQRYNFKKLISSAHWKKIAKDTFIVNEGTYLPELILIYSGLAEVRHQKAIVAMLRDGQFAGEMSFLTNNPTTADVIAATDVEYVFWNKHELEELMKKSPEISSDLQKIFNTDLIHKLMKLNREKS